jgi:hypothetical protein
MTFQLIGIFQEAAVKSPLLSTVFQCLRYAYLRTDGAAPTLDTPEACNNAITVLLGDCDKAIVFRDNVWRPPTSFAPLRGVPLQYILRHRHGDAVVRGIDVGAGLNNLISKLNSQAYFDADVPRKDKLASVAGRVNVSLGLGIDKQEPAALVYTAEKRSAATN